MHCPKCGQLKASDEIRYCSRCGFLMTGVSALIANNGKIPDHTVSSASKDSPRKRGVKQGIFIFLLTLLIVPLVSVFHAITRTEPFLAAISSIVLVVGGILRIVYALMFESTANSPLLLDEGSPAHSNDQLGAKNSPGELPSAGSIPAAVYTAPGVGAWKDTNDLSVPASVTDSTTKLLAREEET